MISKLIKKRYKNICILGMVKDQRLLAKIYSIADIFVICSKRENFPTTCVESQCCGTPVTGFHTGGTAETSLSGEGDFVPYGALKALEEKVRKITPDLKDRKKLEQSARQKFSKDKMFQEYQQLYHKLSEKDKKKILLIDVNCKGSSTGKIVYDIYSKIRSNGNEAAICYGRGRKIREESIYKFGIDLETYLHAFIARITGLNGFFSVFSTLRLLTFIKRYKPDIIHIHELHAYFVNLKPLLQYIKKSGIKLIWTFHCEYMYTGKCGYAYECEKWKTECMNCPHIRDYPKSLFFDRTSYMFRKKKKLLKDLDVIIVTPSQWLAERVRQSFLKDKPVYVINNGIDTDIFHQSNDKRIRKILKIPLRHKIVLAVAPDIMDDRKGGRWILKMAKDMEKEEMTFVLAGQK